MRPPFTAKATLVVMVTVAIFFAPSASALTTAPWRKAQDTRKGPTTKPTTMQGYPNAMFPPDATWSTQKAPPKDSLASLPTPQNHTAVAWKLNVIELIHWLSFPLGFYVAHYLFVNSEVLAKMALGGDMSRVFFIILGLLCQVFGGGISGNLMHMYEGWQVAPFRNPLQSDKPWDVGRVMVPRFNNAWLRSCAYQMLFTFQSLGLGLFTLGVFGANCWTTALVAGSVAVALLGPKEPRISLTRTVDGEERPALPLSWSLVLVFAINIVANLAANVKLFYPAIAASFPNLWPAGLVVGSFASPILIGIGGGIEGWFAETSFNQHHHFIAFVTLLCGLTLSRLVYQILVTHLGPVE